MEGHRTALHEPWDVLNPPGGGLAETLDSRPSGCILGTESAPDHLGAMDDADLERLAVDLQRHMRASGAVLAHVVGAIDERQIAERRYALGTKQWLGRFCRQTPAEASKTVTTARALRSLPTVAERALAGDIPAASLDLLASTWRAHREAFAHHEETFADAAGTLDARDLRRAVGYWRQQVDGDCVTGDIERQRAQRRVGIHQTFDGMWHLEGLLDPISGSTVSTALASHADPGLLDPTDTRTHGQRTADALVDICHFGLDHDTSIGTSGGVKPHLTVTVDLDHLTGVAGCRLPEIDDASVTPETVRRLACDADVVRIVVDADSQPLDVGRSVRTVTPAIRRALDLRDGGCVWRGCGRSVGWADAHHVIHWADGGPTSLDNMVLLCRRHHTAVHEGGRADLGLRSPP